ncbi:MAG: carboxypeptidase-like regulatory domain-containing protein, partial [Cyclobacteriaceae bacterium]
MKTPFTLTILLLLITATLSGQDLDVSGQVTDAETGEALIGATVVVQGTTDGTVTDLDGNYRLTVKNSETTLEFSYIGYKTMSVPLNGRTSVDIAMNLDAEQLEEVVVVGYGTQKQRDLTSAISTVKAEEITQ